MRSERQAIDGAYLRHVPAPYLSLASREYAVMREATPVDLLLAARQSSISGRAHLNWPYSRLSPYPVGWSSRTLTPTYELPSRLWLL